MPDTHIEAAQRTIPHRREPKVNIDRTDRVHLHHAPEFRRQEIQRSECNQSIPTKGDAVDVADGPVSIMLQRLDCPD